MIVTEEFSINNKNFIRHYSDSNFKIRQIETGRVYDEAVDLLPCRYTYEETDEAIKKPEEEVVIENE